MLRAAVPLGLVLLLGAGCAEKPPADPAQTPVALIDDETLSLADLQRYLQANLLEDGEASGMSAEELDRIKSRLFDAFVEEHLLRLEARRRDDEQQPLPDLSEPPSEAEVREHLEQHRERFSGSRQVELSALMLDSMEQARRAAEQIARGRMTFDEAVATHEATPGHTRARRIPWDALSEEVRATLDGVPAGKTCGPLEVDGEAYLFRVDAWLDTGTADEQELLDLAAADLVAERRDRLYRGLLLDGRNKLAVRLATENLPFRYVAEEAGEPAPH